MIGPIKLDCATIALIAEAVASGRVVQVPEGVRALLECSLAQVNAAPIRAEACGRGQQVDRAPHLDEIDKERA